MLRPWVVRSVSCAALTAAALLAAAPVQAATTQTAPRYTATAWPSALSTATGMAAHLCGNQARWTQIRDANHLSAPYWLIAGRSYAVPCATVAAARPVPAPAPPAAASSWAAPLAGTLRCVSRFHAPRPSHLHQGIDLTAASGTRIRAIRAGTVKTITWDNGAGWYVMLSHGNGVYSVYMHNRSRSTLRVGQRVAAGQTIALVGSTGHSSGPHLHIEIHIHGAWSYPRANPATFLRARGINVRGC